MSAGRPLRRGLRAAVGLAAALALPPAEAAVAEERLRLLVGAARARLGRGRPGRASGRPRGLSRG